MSIEEQIKHRIKFCEKAKRMSAEGVTWGRISEVLGVDRMTLRRWYKTFKEGGAARIRSESLHGEVQRLKNKTRPFTNPEYAPTHFEHLLYAKPPKTVSRRK